jgi:hypothetical protein
LIGAKLLGNDVTVNTAEEIVFRLGPEIASRVPGGGVEVLERMFCIGVTGDMFPGVV